MSVYKTAVAVLVTIVMIVMTRPAIQDNFSVTNMLRDKILMVHCRSKDDDLDAHAVAVDDSIGWSFGPSFSGETLFWCRLAVEDKRLTFTAYNESERNIRLWYVRDDGVYGWNKQNPKVAWKSVWPRH
ncbi:unnamed protein product [Linum tenue]|uniref:S-protein homolog n=1 Tax=Linum tenue TaxID=586396 RepID=A0AAV0L2A7_9ROSI|nr:unnamed protein product [Linum tenue]